MPGKIQRRCRWIRLIRQSNSLADCSAWLIIMIDSFTFGGSGGGPVSDSTPSLRPFIAVWANNHFLIWNHVEREREREKGDNEKCCWWCCCCCWCCWRPVAKRQDAETLKREKMKKENFCSLSWFFWRIFFFCCCCCCCCCCLFLLLLRRLLLLLLLFLLVSIASRRSLPAASRPLTKTNGKSREASARQFIYSSAFLSLSFSFSLVNKYTRDKHCGRPRNSTRIANDRI